MESRWKSFRSIILSWIHNLVWIAQHLDRKIYCSSLSVLSACRFKDSSCSRRRSLCGLPVGEVHRQVGFYFACLLWYFVQRRHVQVWPLGTRRWLGTQGLQQVEGAGRDVVQVREHFSVPLFQMVLLLTGIPKIFLVLFSTGSFLNRTTQDCTWMDPNLLCQDYEMDFSMTVSNLILSKSISIYMTVSNLISSLFITVSSSILFKSYDSASQRAWFGGDYMSIIGECECRWNRTFFLQKQLLHPIVMW